MKYLFIILIFSSLQSAAQCVTYKISVKGDTLNCTDKKGLKQGKWINRYDEVRGEAGYEEEGVLINSKKEGIWRLYSLQGDLAGVENYRWGNKDGVQQYYNMMGDLVLEESWKAVNPDNPYDTIKVFNLTNPDDYEWKVVKLDGVALKHGTWKFYDNGIIVKTEKYVLDKLETKPPKNDADSTATVSKAKKPDKPSAIQDYEKKNKNKKSVKYKDGATGY
jgi:hypothetical protein